jgi:hypothetical protein
MGSVLRLHTPCYGDEDSESQHPSSDVLQPTQEHFPHTFSSLRTLWDVDGLGCITPAKMLQMIHVDHARSDV